MFTKIKNCRICGNDNINQILDLGNQSLTGVFPKPEEQIDKSPLILARCQKCGLVQLLHTYNLTKMYGDNYGYHSSLNSSMVKHLNELVQYIEDKIIIQETDIIIDIGSNDGTTLKQYKKGVLIGVDPTINKFQKYYPDSIKTFADFFPSTNLISFLNGQKAKVITSIACFYDLEDPVKFANNIENILDDNGIWIMEQGYLPTVIKNLAFDTICHEHLEYYGLCQIKKIADNAKLKIIDVRFDDTNGGSFMVVLAKQNSCYKENKNLIDNILYLEKNWNNEKTFLEFEFNVLTYKDQLHKLLLDIKRGGYSIAGYGASTKGNVLLQYCNIDFNILDYIVEVNSDKFGCVTPGTNIPIVSENEDKKSDFFLVLPWHFKENILKKNWNKKYRFIFPLPKIEII